MDLNVKLTVNQTAVREYVGVVANELARSLAKRSSSFIDVDISTIDAGYQVVLTFDKGEKTVIKFIPGTTVLPVMGLTNMTQLAPGITTELIEEQLRDIVPRMLEKYARRMVSVDLR